MIRPIALSLSLAAFAGSALAGPAEDLAEARPVIASANADWADGLQAQDPTRLARAYAPDAVTVSAMGEILRSRSDLEILYRDRFAADLEVVAAEIRQGGLVVLGPGLLQEWGEGRLTVRRTDGSTTTSTGVYSTVWRRGGDGRWRIVRNLSL